MNYLKITIAAMGFLISNFVGLSQSILELSTGYGWPDLINFRIIYGQNIQVGGGFGFLKIGDKEITGPYLFENSTNKKVSIDLFYHSLGVPKYLNIKPWYINFGICYFWSKDINELNQYPGLFDQKIINIYFRVGRDLNLTKNIGLSFDLGPLMPFVYDDYHDKYTFDQILPAISINLFIRPKII